jgi:hypothetical protein
MDGGWKLCSEVTSLESILSNFQGETKYELIELVKNYGMITCTSLARDVGPSPPNPIEVTLSVPPEEPLGNCLHVWKSIGLPPIPDSVISIIKRRKRDLNLVVRLSEESLVRVAIVVSPVDDDEMKDLCNITNGDYEKLLEFGKSVHQPIPTAFECQVIIIVIVMIKVLNSFWLKGLDIVFIRKILMYILYTIYWICVNTDSSK